jgi:ATP-dependent helicase YprA (DUF1998 family)
MNTRSIRFDYLRHKQVELALTGELDFAWHISSWKGHFAAPDGASALRRFFRGGLRAVVAVDFLHVGAWSSLAGGLFAFELLALLFVVLFVS